MKIFRSIGMAMALAMSCLFSFPAFAVEFAVKTFRVVASGSYGESQAKLKVDLAQHYQAAQSEPTKVNSDLLRSGHGFMQSKAEIGTEKLDDDLGMAHA